MPIGRYFLFAGSVLLSLLYLADWYMPHLAAEPAHSDVDRSIIRIHSEHHWPKAVAIDTSVETIDPSTRDDFPPSLVEPNRPRDKSQNEAFAYAPALLARPSQPPKPRRLTSRLTKRPMRAIRRKLVSEQTQPAPFLQSEW
jgi:hypothetical protein